MFDLSRAQDRIAQLGQLLGPIYVDDCGHETGEAGEIYFTGLTNGEYQKLRALQRKHQDTYYYRQLLLRAKDKDGDRIWEDDELDDVLGGGIDPSDAAYITSCMYLTDLKHEPDRNSSAFSKVAARAKFDSYNTLLGPVSIPKIDRGEDLDIYYRNVDGYADCAINAIRAKNENDYDLRELVERALDKSGKKMFSNDSASIAKLAAAITQKDLNDVILAMVHPRFMSEEDRIRMSVQIETDPDLDMDDLKN